MQKDTRNFVEGLLRDYPRIPRYIHRKEQEIKYPFRAYRDDNVGGGQGHSNNDSPTERIVFNIAGCDVIEGFKKQRNAISKALKKSDPVFVKVVERYYFDEYNTLSISAIGVEYGYSSRTLYNERNKLFENILIHLGWNHVIERDAILNEKSDRTAL
ncbi:hypothetical protein MOO46_07875 (plasmid) [Apilactobacillus apisilvae]|uniref:Transcriptional regulator n=1 Tax=Apilactobacillus apisilvae TaxID=2923364 RepID=A0ABY4PJ45_9LACO|nr:hypothetical protein [Apilactobacillus apisilvae]UQS85850.1 hypothetical protein MOO46_07875 [Apilactobacillus apisilvae]